ncbi:MAG: branched-chain amino acid ABC transporter substrate-binding protein [Chloroflexota bacterium]
MKLSRIGALVAVGVLATAACNAPSASGGGSTGKTIKVAIDLPLQGSDKSASDPIVNGVKLAVKEANAAGQLNGYTLTVDPILDDALNGAHDPQTGAKNMQSAVSDPAIGALIGPLNSSVAKAEIPITNAAGLLQCSPANTNEGLTKPEFGAKDVRKTNPDKINYIRVVTTDDKQGPAAATFAIKTLGKKNAYVIDDTETFGKGIADNFIKEFQKEGGTVVARDGAPKTTSDYTPLLTAAKAKNPDVVYFGGVTATGGGIVRKQMAQAGLGDVPFIGPDGIQDGTVESKGSFLNIAGPAAAGSYSSLAAIGDFPAKAEFVKKYAAEYPGLTATGYSATGYSCAQVIIAAIKQATNGFSGDQAALREAIRAAAVNPATNYDTILGQIHFDQNGDTSQLIVSFYKAPDPLKGDWTFDSQIDFAQAAGGGASGSPAGGASASPAGGASASPAGGASASPAGGASASPAASSSASPAGGASASPSSS